MNLLLLALVPACFALNPVIGRALAEQFGPATLSVMRWALSALLVALLMGLRGEAERWHASAGLITRLGVLGILGMGFCAFAAYEAARDRSHQHRPHLRLHQRVRCRLEIAAGRQRATPMLGFGIATCLFGVVPILTRGHPGVLQDWTFTAGDLWAAAGMLVFVIYTVALRRCRHRSRAVHGDERRRPPQLPAGGRRRAMR